jgi:hypothetical protein
MLTMLVSRQDVSSARTLAVGLLRSRYFLECFVPSRCGTSFEVELRIMRLSTRPLGSTLAQVLLIAAPCLYLACKAEVVSTPTEAEPTVPDQPGTPPDVPPPAPGDGGATDDGGGVAPQNCTGNPLGAETVDGATLKVVGQGPFPDGPHIRR